MTFSLMMQAEHSNGIHHILVLISNFADLYFPKSACYVLEFGEVSAKYSPEAFKTALKQLDENLIIRIERGCNNGDLIKIFTDHVAEIWNNIPDTIPRSKVNISIMLMTALRIYHTMFSPLFCKNMEYFIEESSHQLLDMLVGSLFNRQMTHDSKFLSIVIDEMIDQDFSKDSPLSAIVKQGRKFHTALLGATQDYYNQGSSSLDTMKQANIQSFCRPGKSEDHVAQKLGYSNVIDAGFHKSKAGDTIIEFYAYNKDTGINEAITLSGFMILILNTRHGGALQATGSLPISWKSHPSMVLIEPPPLLESVDGQKYHYPHTFHCHSGFWNCIFIARPIGVLAYGFCG